MTGTTLKITKKNVIDEELPHALFLTARQKTKIRNVFANNMWKDIKISEVQRSKIIQSGEILSSRLGQLGKKVVTTLLFLLFKIICLD